MRVNYIEQGRSNKDKGLVGKYRKAGRQAANAISE